MGRVRVAVPPLEPDTAPPVAPTVWRPADLSTYEGPLLLDTHVWIWYLEGDATRTSPGLVALLERSGAAGGLIVSDISYWEVSVRCAKGKLVLSLDPLVWLKRAERAPGMRFLPLDRDVLLVSTRLTGMATSDPADRMLVAAAQLSGIPLVTADGLIIEYARENVGTPVVDARIRVSPP